MNDTQLTPFSIIGLAIITSNEPGKADQDIPELWSRFLSADRAAEIRGIDSKDIYCVYTAYEGDHTRPYTAILGYKVKEGTTVPEGYRQVTVAGGTYRTLAVSGKLSDSIVFDAWVQVWNAGWPRAYQTDLEVYSSPASDPETAVVTLYIGLKS